MATGTNLEGVHISGTMAHSVSGIPGLRAMGSVYLGTAGTLYNSQLDYRHKADSYTVQVDADADV